MSELAPTHEEFDNPSRIPHRDLPLDLFEAESPHVAASERERRISRSPFLQSLIDRRPDDAVDNPNYVKFLSPMVRYSKLPFRILCRRYGADLAFTPMLIAKDMITTRQDKEVVIDEFSTCSEDRPLVAQLAANDGIIAQKAAQLVAPFVDGIDINCGCPQTWVLKEGIGGALSSKPELVEDIVKQVRAGVPPQTPVSIKIRLRPNLNTTLELIRRAERMGVEWITVHGRTKEERTSVSVSKSAIRFVRSAVQIPIIFNGDIINAATLKSSIEATNADGVLIARGALSNPAVFAGLDVPPVSCIRDYLALSTQYGGCGQFAMHSHHLLYMMYSHVDKADRLRFTNINSMAGVFDFCYDMGWLYTPRSDCVSPPSVEFKDGQAASKDEIKTESGDVGEDILGRSWSQYQLPELGDAALASRYAAAYSPSEQMMRLPFQRGVTETKHRDSSAEPTKYEFERDCEGVARSVAFLSQSQHDATAKAARLRRPEFDLASMLNRWPYYPEFRFMTKEQTVWSNPASSISSCVDAFADDDMYCF